MRVNDVHSRLNETRVAEIVTVDSLETLRRSIAASAAQDRAVALAGGRHSMGGQQFASGGTLLDTRGMKAVLGFDRKRGLVEVEAGIQWPTLVEFLIGEQEGEDRPWGIAQKQTGADRFTIGGSVAANCHGRGLSMRPIIGDVESFQLVLADGSLATCSRQQNTELFGLVLGGYGLFGAIYSVELRLTERQKLERVVEMAVVDDLERLFEDRIAAGFLYGDFQFATDPSSDGFLRRGVLSCYRPVNSTEIPKGQLALTREDWERLLVLAHTDKARAFEEYAEHYVATSGQVYWSDLHQFADYVDGYHDELDRSLGAAEPGTEMISELYVPREHLDGFLADVAGDFRSNGVDVIYGTVRLIEKDEESYLAWARERYACVIFNLHTGRTDAGIGVTAEHFRRLIDRARERGGSYFPTYHRWGDKGTGRGLLPAVHRVPTPEGSPRPTRPLSKRLVPALSAALRRELMMPVALRAAILIVSVLDVPVLRSLVRACTRTPVAETRDTEYGPLEIVRPTGSGPWPAWVFMNGAHPERRREPVVQRLLEGLARAGYLVVVPDPPGLADEQLTMQTLEGATSAVRAATKLPDSRGGRVGLLGASTGAGLAILVAADPELRDRISIVAAAVPFADLKRILCLATTCSYGMADDVTTFPESELLARVARRSLRAVASAEPPCPVEALLANRDFAEFPALYAQLPETVRAVVTRLSPLTVASEVRAPVEVVVPPRDEYFPRGEAIALARALPNARLTVTGTLDHTRPSAKVRSIGGLLGFLGFVLRGLHVATNS